MHWCKTVIYCCSYTSQNWGTGLIMQPLPNALQVMKNIYSRSHNLDTSLCFIKEMTSQNIILQEHNAQCVSVCASRSSHYMQGHCLAVQQQRLQPGACSGAKRVCWHTIKKKKARHTNTHTEHIQAQRTKKKKKHTKIDLPTRVCAQTDTRRHTHTCAPLRSWSIHDKSKSLPDVRQSNQRAWCSNRESQ